MTVAEYLVNEIIKYDVTDIFGIPGGVILDFLYAAEKRLSAHLSYHEQAAGFEALGYAQVNYKLGVAYVTRGPGFTNIITAIADAYSDSVPILIITAHEAKITNRRLRFEYEQEIDVSLIVDSICKKVTVIDELEQAIETIPNLLMVAMDGRKGPVILDMCAILWNKEI